MHLQQNVGTPDRIVRVILGIALAGLVASGTLPPPFPVVAGVLAVVMLATAVLGFCPIYAVLGIRTCPIERIGSR